MIVDYTQGSIPRELIAFSTPLFLSNLLQVFYNMIDMIVVGHFAGKAGLSAVSIGGDVTSFLTFFAIGFCNAGQVIISQFVGADRRDRLGRFVGTMFLFLFSISITLSILCLLLLSNILRWMNTPPESWDAAYAYAITCVYGLVFIYGYNMVSAVLRGMGDSKRPFYFVGIAAVMNIVLDLWFVGGLNMGAFGAALATVISQSFSFVFALVYLAKNRELLGFSLDKSCLAIDRVMLSNLVKLGLPMAIKSASVHISKLFVNSWINSYGVTVSAVAGIGNKLGSISTLFSSSINYAGSSMVGQNIGAQKYDRVRRIVLIDYAFCGAILSVLIAILLLFPRAVFGIFTDEADVLAVCMEYLPVAVLVFLGSVARSGSNALIDGSGNYKVNFIGAILDGIVMRVGLSVLFGLVLGGGYMGFWYGDAIASFTPLGIGIVFYLSGKWKTRAYVISDGAQ